MVMLSSVVFDRSFFRDMESMRFVVLAMDSPHFFLSLYLFFAFSSIEEWSGSMAGDCNRGILERARGRAYDRNRSRREGLNE